MSVTNDIENVLTEINKEVNIKECIIRYQDSDEDWSQVVPIWLGQECVNVSFH